MTKEEQQTIFKWLCESLPYGIKGIATANTYYLNDGCENYKEGNVIELDLEDLNIHLNNQPLIIPIAKPLSMLTEPIKVEGYNEGKEFVPIDYLYEKYPRVTKSKFGMLQDIKLLTEKMEFVIVCELLKIGFFPYDQTYFKKGYLIKESEV